MDGFEAAVESSRAGSTARDSLSRGLRDLRISVTDRCNLRCRYCMPREVFGSGFEFLPRAEILTYEEIDRLARIFVRLGVRKIRLTGGEPLLRRDLADLVALLTAIPGVEVALTTNGALLAEMASKLSGAGLHRVTVSLDSLDDGTFARMHDADLPVAEVLAGIDAAARAGLGPVKVNAVVKRGVNDHEIAAFAGRFRHTGHIPRFIEYMDVGNSNGWCLDDVVPAAEIVETIAAIWPIEPVEKAYPGEVAGRWRYQDGAGELGVISAVSAPFCGGCTRARISAEGKLFTCLFAATGTDLRAALRSGTADGDLETMLRGVWQRRVDRYSELRSRATQGLRRVEMSYIGG